MTDNTPSGPRKCARCGEKPVEQKWRPFCSRRCADLDLGSWFQEDYSIPVALTAEDLEDASDEMLEQLVRTDYQSPH